MDIDFNVIIQWLIDSLNPKINIFFALGLIVITQVVKAWFKKLLDTTDKILIVPAILSVIMTVLHIILDTMSGFSIPATLLTYITLSVGGYKVGCVVLPKFFKSKYELEGNINKRKKKIKV